MAPWFRTSIVWFLLMAATGAVFAQAAATGSRDSKKAKDDPAYRDAMDLYDHGKFVDAMPIFERLAASYPSDPVSQEGWAWCLMEYAATLPDAEQRQKVRVRARNAAMKAKELGDNSQILQLMLEIPEDGSESTFSDRKEIDEAMKSAEADFARGDLDKARDGYLRALLLDPNSYEAALFIGDVYFKKNEYGSAGEWFSRAISIDPNRETAYRYWGDALSAMEKDDEARVKFIEAIVAEPYRNTSWFGVSNWVQRHQLKLNNVRLKDRSSVSVKDDKNINMTLDSSLGKDDPNGLAWTTYGIARAAWHTEKSEKEFPGIPRNRRTLQEETQALQLMITVLKEQKDYEKKRQALDPSLQALIKVQEAGFLEPFVLLNRADSEIAQDYETYRRTNREKIRRYLDEFVVPKTH